jgi:hypothetical protein
VLGLGTRHGVGGRLLAGEHRALTRHLPSEPLSGSSAGGECPRGVLCALTIAPNRTRNTRHSPEGRLRRVVLARGRNRQLTGNRGLAAPRVGGMP